MPYKSRKKQLKAQQEHYQKNKDKYREQLYARRKKNFDYVLAFKLANPCKCGEAHPAALDFHHRVQADKEINLSVAIQDWGLARLKTEIDKCDILCSNCHRKLHWIDAKNKYFNMGT